MRFDLETQQAEFVFSPEPYCAYIAAVGCGKTTALIAKAMLHAQTPNNLILVVRKTFRDLADSTIKDFEQYTGLKVVGQNKEIKFANGSCIMFRHGDELPVLKNLSLGLALIEQCEECPDATAYEFLKQRMRRAGEVKVRSVSIVGNTAGHNWVWQEFKNVKKPEHVLVEATTYDFRHHLPADYIKNLETLPDKLYRRFVMNSWDIAEGLVYDQFSEANIHAPFYIPEAWEQGFALDHGFKNPTGVLWYAIDFDGTLWIYDEHYQSEKPISYHAAVIKERHGMSDGIADPSIFAKNQSKNDAIYSIADEYVDHGISLRPAAKEEEKAAIARINDHFKSGKIKVFNRCQHFINEVQNWKYEELRPGKLANHTERPVDHANHLMDCLKYIDTTRMQPAQPVKRTPDRYSPQWFIDQKTQVEAEPAFSLGAVRTGF